MSKTKKANEGAVASIGNTDLVMVEGANGGYRPISFSALMAAIRGGIQIGGRNYILNSDTPKSGPYGLGSLDLSIPWQIGKKYVLTLWGVTIGTGKYNSLQVWNAIANKQLFNVYEVGNGVYRGTFEPNSSLDTSLAYRLAIHSFPKDVTTTTSFQRAKFEEGNIATDWSPAPEDIASGNWGGVNQRFTISYKIYSREWKKGGLHEQDDQTIGKDQECPDSYLSFRTLESLCEFIGRAAESDFDEGNNARVDHSQRKRGVADSGVFQGRPMECEHKPRHKKAGNDGVAHNIQSQCKFDSQSIWNGGFGFGYSIVEPSVCSNAPLDGVGIATRKEVAA